MSLKYRPEIDGLRAIAVLPVVFYHADIFPFSGGFVGVDVFFVISGYLITSIALHDSAEQKFSVLRFYERRARRILPALIFVILCTSAMAWMTLTPDFLDRYFQSVAAASGFLSNFFFWMESGYFAPDSKYVYLLHTWSLAIEEQFYVVFPFLFLYLYKYGRSKIAYIFSAAGLASLIACELLLSIAPDAAFYLLPTRMWELLCGAVCAVVLYRYRVPTSDILTIFGLTLILWSVFHFSDSTAFPGINAAIPVLGTALIVVFARDGSRVAQIIAARPLVQIGLISYSLYLWHHPILVFTRLNDLGPVPEGTAKLLAILVSFALAWLTFVLVERPFRRPGKSALARVTPKRFVMASGVALLALGTVAYFGRGPLVAHAISESARLKMQSIARVQAPLCEDTSGFCTDGGIGNVDILLLGDSNAYHFSSALQEVAEQAGLKFANMTKGGCLPLSDLHVLSASEGENARCIEFNARIRAALESGRFDGTAIVSAAWLLYLFGTDLYREETSALGLDPISILKLSADGRTPLGEKTPEVFRNYLEDVIAFLSSRANKLIIVGPIPPALVDFGLRQSLLDAQSSDFSRFTVYDDVFDRMIDTARQRFDFIYLEPGERICHSGRCPVENDGRYLYGDPTHFSAFGQSEIMRPLLGRALELE